MTTPAQRAPYNAAVATFLVVDWLMRREAAGGWPPTSARAATRAQIGDQFQQRIGNAILDAVRDDLAGAGLIQVTEFGPKWEDEVWALAEGYTGDGSPSPEERARAAVIAADDEPTARKPSGAA